MKEKMKICCCFAKKEPTGLSWPGIGQDYSKREKYYEDLLNKNFGKDFEFCFVERTASATDEELKELINYDGFIMVLLAHGTALAQRIAPFLKNGLIIDDPYGGSGDAIRVANIIKENIYPLRVIGTQDEDALLHKVKVYLAVPKLKNSKILVFKNFNKMSPEKEVELAQSIGTGSTMKRYKAGREGFEKTVKSVENLFGIKIITKTLEDLENYQKDIDEKEIEFFADKWKNQAERVVEPTYDDLKAVQECIWHYVKQKKKLRQML